MSPTDSSIPIDSPLLVKRLSPKAKLPTRGSALAAGYDLYRYVSYQQVARFFVTCPLTSLHFQCGEKNSPRPRESTDRHTNFNRRAHRNVWTRRASKWSR